MSEPPAPYYLGVDAGGTSTRSALLDATGTVVARGAAGAANHRTTAPDAVQASVRAAIAQAADQLGRAGLEGSTGRVRVRGLAIGWSGLEERGEAAMAAEIGGDAVESDLIIVDSDVMAAHVGAFMGGPGVLVAAGTGSIALAVDDAGRRTRVGGWGHRFGDEGSAAWIGTEGVRAALHAVDGRADETALWRELLTHVGATPSDLDGSGAVHRVTAWLYDPARHLNDVASFAQRVHHAAIAGDPTARGVLVRAGNELAQHVVRAAIALVGLEPLPVAGTGGVWSASATVREACHAAVERSLRPRTVQWHEPRADAAVGAAWMAMLMDGSHAVGRQS